MLVKDLNDIQVYLPVSDATDFDRLKPHLANAERDYIAKAIGQAMYDELDEFAGATINTPLTTVQEDMTELLKIAKVSAIHLAYWIGYDVLNSYISDGGFRRMESESMKSLYKYQEDNLKDYFKVTGFNAIDAMLAFMDANKGSFAEYTSSDEYKTRMGLFVRDTATLNGIYFIGASHLVYKRMIPYLKTAADIYIRPLMGDTNFDKLLAEMVKSIPDANIIAILPKVQYPAVFFAVMMLMEDSGADLTDRGLFFEGRASNLSSDTVKNPATAERIAYLVKRNKGIGDGYLSALKTYLIKNKVTWGDYTAPGGRLPNRDNTGKKSVWA